jgi:hypothetical protein
MLFSWFITVKFTSNELALICGTAVEPVVVVVDELELDEPHAAAVARMTAPARAANTRLDLGSMMLLLKMPAHGPENAREHRPSRLDNAKIWKTVPPGR